MDSLGHNQKCKSPWESSQTALPGSICIIHRLWLQNTPISWRWQTITKLSLYTPLFCSFFPTQHPCFHASLCFCFFFFLNFRKHFRTYFQSWSVLSFCDHDTFQHTCFLFERVKTQVTIIPSDDKAERVHLILSKSITALLEWVTTLLLPAHVFGGCMCRLDDWVSMCRIVFYLAEVPNWHCRDHIQLMEHKFNFLKIENWVCDQYYQLNKTNLYRNSYKILDFQLPRRKKSDYLAVKDALLLKALERMGAGYLSHTPQHGIHFSSLPLSAWVWVPHLHGLLSS